jgi:hypothetical protein
MCIIGEIVFGWIRSRYRYLEPSLLTNRLTQGCQMVYFQTKPSNFGIFWKALELIFFISFMTIW